MSDAGRLDPGLEVHPAQVGVVAALVDMPQCTPLSGECLRGTKGNVSVPLLANSISFSF